MASKPEGERSDRRGLGEADLLYIHHVGRGSLYGLPASMRGTCFLAMVPMRLPQTAEAMSSTAPTGTPWRLSRSRR